ncbi:MAG: trimethylamine methyltransferase family protein [Pseudomonadota bacterium]
MSGSETTSNDYRPASLSDIEKLHEASLRILEKTGAAVFHPQALELFKKAGAEVDGRIVRLKPSLVEWALKTVPKELTIYNRNLEPAMSIGGGRRASHYGVGSDSINVYDLEGGRRRRAVLGDISTGMRLVSHLPDVHFVMSMFVPSDVSAEDYGRRQMLVMLNENIKPIVFTGLASECAAEAVAMAAAVHGPAELSRKPFIINYVNTVTALKHNHESLQRLLDAAAANIPTIYAPGNSRGTTAPMTLAGMLALGNAGQLVGLALSQLAREGSPFILNNPSVGAMDMKTMVDLYVSPDGGAYGCALAEYYGLAALCSAGAGDSKIFDGQAAAEAALTLFSTTMRGANLIQNLGYLDSAMTGSFEMIVFCHEIIGWLKRFLRPLRVDDESLALEVIDQAGPECNFLTTEHTFRHYLEDWRPGLLDRSSHGQWEKKGSRDLRERANAMARDLASRPPVEPLPPETLARLQAML